MKRVKRWSLLFWMAVSVLFSMLFSLLSQRNASAQLSIQNTVPIGSGWADDRHKFSSFDDKKALKVDAAYGFKIQATEQTKTVIEKGTEAKEPPQISMPQFLKKYTWFRTDENTAGKIRIRKTNLLIYQCKSDGKEGRWEKIDMVMTVTNLEKYQQRDGYVAIGTGVCGCAYVGIEEMTMQSRFYKAGTNTPVTIQSNITLKDLDTRQYIGMKADTIHGEYVSKNTKLSYGKSGSSSIYYADFDENYSSEDFTSVGFTFVSDSFEYTFGRRLNEAPTGQEQYVGSGQNMVRFDTPAPEKMIVASDGTQTEHYKAEHLAEQWNYEVRQTIADGIPQAHYYENFMFRDQIESCMKILDVKVYGDGSDVSAEFDISTTGNQVKAILKNPSDSEFYKRGEYVLKIKVCMNIPENATKEQLDELRKKWQEHGHYNESKTVILEKNRAETIIDGKNMPTNEAVCEIELPKQNENDPGLFIKKETQQYEYQAKDNITYKVTVKNRNDKAKTSYFTIQDLSIPGTVKLDQNSVKVTGIDEENYTLQKEKQGWILKSKGDYALPAENEIVITYTVKGSSLANGTLIDNEASAWAAGVLETKDQRQIYVNSPKTDVVKDAPQKVYKKGDLISYQAIFTNQNPGTFMRDLVIGDEVKAEGVRIVPGTLCVLSDGEDVTESCSITFGKDGRSYEVKTPLELKNGSIPAMESSWGKKTGDYEKLSLTDKIEISYQAVIEGDGLEGKVIENIVKAPATKNTNGDVIRDDPDIPSGGGEAIETVKVKAPQLQIVKHSDKEIYSVGETGNYKLVVTQKKEGLTAKKVVVSDAFEKDGMKILNLKVSMNKKDITEECTIDVKDQHFVVETGKDLGENDILEISYQVLFEKKIEGAVKNVAVVQSENTPEDQDENIVVLKPPVLKIEKTSDHKVYKEGQIGTYELRVTEKNPGMTAHQVVIEDQFENKEMKIFGVRVKYNGEDITSQCEIVMEENSHQFRILTGKDLGDQDEITVTYQVRFETMISGEIKNTAISYSEDAARCRDDYAVVMEKTVPKLSIVKKTNRTVYGVGDLCRYEIRASQTVKDAIAKNVVIEDKLSKEGAQIVENTMEVIAPDGEDITKECIIDVTDTGYRIVTKKNLSYDEEITIRYQVKLKSGKLAGEKLKNSAKISADNADPASAVQEIRIEKKGEVKNKNLSNFGDGNSPKTGDDTSKKWIVMCLLSGVGIGFLIYKKYRKS